MGRIWAIAINTFREAVRDKVLYGVLALASAVLVLTLALAELSLHQQRRVVLDIGLASISAFSVIIAVFLGSSLLYKEIERKTLYVILPKPIHRWEFLLGKYLGIALTGAVFVAMMGGIQLWVGALQAGAHVAWLVGILLGAPAVLGLAMWRARDRTAVLVPWSLLFLLVAAYAAGTTDFDVSAVMAALLLTVGEVLVLSAVALLFSSFSTPFLTGVLTLGVWIVGRSADEMAEMNSQTIPASVREGLHALAHVVPNFHLFVPGQHALSGEVPLPDGLPTYLATTMGYAVGYAAVSLLLASLIFRRRDFL
ncbi:MAG: ABC transporter permease subunit [Sandaracinaceae bacterium]